MNKILITGGSGFFASRLKLALESKFEILSPNHKELEIRDLDQVNSVFESFKPDYVVHTAAVAQTAFCNENPDIANDINVNGSINIAKACNKIGAPMVFISTEQIFNGNLEPGPYDESHVPNPDTVYGQTKLAAEKALSEILNELWILRFTWLFGLPERNAGMSPNILWDTLNSAMHQKIIKASTNEYRGLTSVYELVDQFENVFDIPYGIYHIGSENPMSRYDSVKTIFDTLNLSDLKYLEKDEVSYKANPRDIRLDCSKIRNLGFKFSPSPESLVTCLKEFSIVK